MLHGEQINSSDFCYFLLKNLKTLSPIHHLMVALKTTDND